MDTTCQYSRIGNVSVREGDLVSAGFISYPGDGSGMRVLLSLLSAVLFSFRRTICVLRCDIKSPFRIYLLNHALIPKRARLGIPTCSMDMDTKIK